MIHTVMPANKNNRNSARVVVLHRNGNTTTVIKNATYYNAIKIAATLNGRKTHTIQYVTEPSTYTHRGYRQGVLLNK